MGILDSISHFLNPEVKKTYEHILVFYNEGLHLYCNAHNIPEDQIRSETDMPFSVMQRICNDEAEIRGYDKEIKDYKHLSNFRLMYPHGFVVLCDECLGGVIYDSSIDMPHNCVNHTSVPGNFKYYHNQYCAYYTKKTNMYPYRPYNVRASAKLKQVDEIDDLDYEDVKKLLMQKNRLHDEEQRINGLLEQERIDNLFETKIIAHHKRKLYYEKFLKAERRSVEDKKFLINNYEKLDHFIYREVLDEYTRLRMSYPEGMKLYQAQVSSDHFTIVMDADRVKLFDKNAARYNNLNQWELEQKSHAEISRKCSPDQMGCYSYDVRFKKIRANGLPIDGEFKVWQHFFASYYPYGSDEDCSAWYQEFLQNEKLRSMQSYYKQSAYDMILDLILKLKRKSRDLAVIYGDSCVSDYAALNSYHFAYLREKLKENNIPFTEFYRLPKLVFPKNTTILVIEFFTTNEHLKQTCEKIISVHEDKMPNISYISMRKEFSKEEMAAVIEKRKKEEERIAREAREKEEARLRAIREREATERRERERIAREAKEKEEARLRAIREREAAERRERERIEQMKRDTARLRDCVSDWDVMYGGLPYSYLVRYYPTTCDFEATESEWDDRKLIWNFKNTPGKTSSWDHERSLERVIAMVESKLRSTFGAGNLLKLTLVCIPASTQEKTVARYKEFTDRLCEKTGMDNSFDRITVVHSKEERRSGGTSISTDNLSFSQTYFKDRNVLLFDDVITRGDSMRTFKHQMEHLGANVIGGLSIGKTVHERN